MKNSTTPSQLDQRVAQLIAEYSGESVNAAHILCDRHNPEATACRIIRDDLSFKDITFKQLREDSERLASAYSAMGLKAGDRIATLMGKSQKYLATVLAIWRLGAVHVPLFTAFAPPAIAVRTEASDCKLIICDASQRSKLITGDGMPENALGKIITTGDADDNALSFDAVYQSGNSGFPSASVGGDAPLIQIYTSGTTGKPKGVVVPVKAIAAFQTYLEIGLNVSSDDVYWNAADPGWAYGLYYGIVAPLAAGTKTHLLESGFVPKLAFDVLSKFGVTNFAAAPTVYRSLQAAKIPVPEGLKLRHASSAGEPLTPEVNQWAVQSLGVEVHDHYGQTETGMTINNHHHAQLKQPVKPGAMGHPLPGWAAAILKDESNEIAGPGEQGRVAIDLTNSPLAWFNGYKDEPGKSAERFSDDKRWYLTGDAGSIDSEGYFHFASRDDDIIIMAGYRIGPFEVESVLCMHPAVSECAVVAAPDEVRGEVLETFVVLKSDYEASEALTKDLQEWVKRRYAAHAYPRQVHYTDGLPKTPSGKVMRFELRKLLRKDKG